MASILISCRAVAAAAHGRRCVEDSHIALACAYVLVLHVIRICFGDFNTGRVQSRVALFQ